MSTAATHSLIRLERHLFERLERELLQGGDFGRKHLLCRRRRVDTVGLDGDDGVPAVLQERLGVEGHNTRLVGLRDVCEYDVDHGEEHAILVWMASVLNDS